MTAATRPLCCEAFYPDHVRDERVIGMRVCWARPVRRRGRRWVCAYHARCKRVFFRLPKHRIAGLRDKKLRVPLLDENAKRIKREIAMRERVERKRRRERKKKSRHGTRLVQS